MPLARPPNLCRSTESEWTPWMRKSKRAVACRHPRGRKGDHAAKQARHAAPGMLFLGKAARSAILINLGLNG